MLIKTRRSLELPLSKGATLSLSAGRFYDLDPELVSPLLEGLEPVAVRAHRDRDGAILDPDKAIAPVPMPLPVEPEPESQEE